MPAPRDQDEVLAGSLLTGVGEWLKALPKPSAQGNKDWKEQPVNIETWLYDPAYMNLNSIRLSAIQLEALVATDEIDPSKCQYTEIVIEWGKGCLASDHVLTDVLTGESLLISQWIGRSIHLKTFDGNHIFVQKTTPVFHQGYSEIRRFTLSDGSSVSVSPNHRFLTREGWKQSRLLKASDEIFCGASKSDYLASVSLVETCEDANTDFQQCAQENAPNASSTTQDSLNDCHLLHDSYDVRLLSDQDSDRDSSPLQDDVRGHNQHCFDKDDRETLQAHNLICRSSYPDSEAISRQADRADAASFHLEETADELSLAGYQELAQVRQSSPPLDRDSTRIQDQISAYAASPDSFPHWRTIALVKDVPAGEVFDLEVPGTECYFDDQGILHHNSGKDLLAALMALRQVYLLLCLRDPYAYYGMAPGSGIELCNVAYVKAQAKEVFFKQLKGLLQGSRWFKKHKYEVFSESIKFPFNITMLSKAADGDSVEGQNMFFAVMDEAGAFKDTNAVRAMNKGDGDKIQSSAEGIYKVLRSSTRSRFPTVGKVVIISYPRYVDDFIQTKRKENELSDKGWTSGPYATWDVNPRVTRDQFQEDYDKNPETAAAMYECKPPFAQDGYIKHPEKFVHGVARGRNIGLLTPIDEAGVYSPSFHGAPGRYYAIHVDLALNKDKCALALGCQGEPERRLKCPCNAWNMKDVLRCRSCDRPVEQWIETLLPTVVYPLIRIFARTGEKKEVDFAEVREEILWIRERGHYLYSVTYDGWQSQDSIQILDKILGSRKVQTRRYAGANDFREEPIVGVQSVDRTTEAYDTLKEFVYDDRAYIMSAGDGDPTDDQNQDVIAQAYREFRALRMLNNRKVDHPRGGSKDICDAMAGVALQVARMPIMRMRSPMISGWRDS
jgi:hypothetical protein